MPDVLRNRVALVALLGVLLIPVLTSSLRGLTHVLTCAEQVAEPFTVIVPVDGPPTLLSSTVVEPGATPGVCGGLVLSMGIGVDDEGRFLVELPIANTTDTGWRGTVGLDLDGVLIPVDIGEIPAGETRTATVPVRLEPGTREVSGSVLIGP